MHLFLPSMTEYDGKMNGLSSAYGITHREKQKSQKYFKNFKLTTVLRLCFSSKTCYDLLVLQYTNKLFIYLSNAE